VPPKAGVGLFNRPCHAISPPAIYSTLKFSTPSGKTASSGVLSAHQFAQGKQLVFMNQDKAQMVDNLAREYGKIFGFN
jgi:hypothetical protein